MSEVNHTEIRYMILRQDGADAWAEAAKILIALPIECHPVDRKLREHDRAKENQRPLVTRLRRL